MIKKTIYLSESNTEILFQLKKEYGFTSESQVLNYLLSKTQENQEQKIAIAVREELEKNYLQKERIRWATQTAEQNSIIILDAINTLMHKEKLDTCIGVEIAPSPVIIQSRKRLKEKIGHFKQKSDECKRTGQKTGGSQMTPKKA